MDAALRSSLILYCWKRICQTFYSLLWNRNEIRQYMIRMSIIWHSLLQETNVKYLIFLIVGKEWYILDILFNIVEKGLETKQLKPNIHGTEHHFRASNSARPPLLTVSYSADPLLITYLFISLTADNDFQKQNMSNIFSHCGQNNGEN